MAQAPFRNGNRSRSLISVLLLYLAATLPANAQDGGDYDTFNDSFRIYVGGFSPSLSSKISIYGENETPGPCAKSHMDPRDFYQAGREKSTLI